MTRTEKIRKLANAVKAYKGAYNVTTLDEKARIKWLRSPQIDKRKPIVKWLLALGRTHAQIEQDAKTIDGLQNREQFHNWLNGFEKVSAYDRAIQLEKGAQ